MSGSEHAFALIQAALATVLERPPETITRDSRFREDLHADSLALVEVVEIVEERLAGQAPAGFHIDDEDLDSLATVGEAADYVAARL
ncbi:MAG: acyl carrier protein [Mycobacteriales bacterium]